MIIFHVTGKKTFLTVWSKLLPNIYFDDHKCIWYAWYLKNLSILILLPCKCPLFLNSIFFTIWNTPFLAKFFSMSIKTNNFLIKTNHHKDFFSFFKFWFEFTVIPLASHKPDQIYIKNSSGVNAYFCLSRNNKSF